MAIVLSKRRWQLSNRLKREEETKLKKRKFEKTMGNEIKREKSITPRN